jgi:hypothetical protein
MGSGLPGDKATMSTDMTAQMGHGGKDLAAMVRDTRNRFWIRLLFTALPDDVLLNRLQRGAFAYVEYFKNAQNGLVADTSRRLPV